MPPVSLERLLLKQPPLTESYGQNASRFQELMPHDLAHRITAVPLASVTVATTREVHQSRFSCLLPTPAARTSFQLEGLSMLSSRQGAAEMTMKADTRLQVRCTCVRMYRGNKNLRRDGNNARCDQTKFHCIEMGQDDEAR
jgi:hypothetical protein